MLNPFILLLLYIVYTSPFGFEPIPLKKIILLYSLSITDYLGRQYVFELKIQIDIYVFNKLSSSQTGVLEKRVSNKFNVQFILL